MKYKIILFCLMIFSINNSYAQWYSKKYQVNDINLLTKEQLMESLDNTKNEVVSSGLATGIGGVLFVLSINNVWTPKDDPTFVEQLIGQKGMNKIYAGASVGIMVVGSVFLLNYWGRMVKIRSTLTRNYPFSESITISPAIIPNSISNSSCLGVSLALKF